jgi:hypothetical protein
MAPRDARWPQPNHIGTRAVVRYRLPPETRGPHGEHLTDVIGRLLGYDEHEVHLLTRDDRHVTVARDAIVAAKALPPAPARRHTGPDGPSS